jgi:hypothetical protein
MPTQIDACAAHAVHRWSPAKNARELKGSARNAIQGAAWGRLSQQRLRLARIEGLGRERRVVPVAQGHGHLFALVGDDHVPENLEVERRGRVCRGSFVGAFTYMSCGPKVPAGALEPDAGRPAARLMKGMGSRRPRPPRLREERTCAATPRLLAMRHGSLRI